MFIYKLFLFVWIWFQEISTKKSTILRMPKAQCFLLFVSFFVKQLISFFLMCFTCLNSVRNTKSSIGRTLAETIRISPVRRQRGAWRKNCTTFICMSALWCNKYNKRRAVLTSERAERDARRRCQRFTRFSDHVCGWCVQGVSFVNSTLERDEVWIKNCQI